jgi:myosin-5
VAYASESFLEKNKDETPRGASALLESSSKSLVRLLGKITLGDNAVPNAAPKGRSSKKAPTVGSQFAMQLTELRRRIDQTEPHYIRCLKPNQSLMPEDFDNAMVADQLRYAGVLEAIRVSRVGYSQRYSHANFLGRYSFIAPKAVKLARDDKKVDILVVEIAKKVWEQLNPNKAP